MNDFTVKFVTNTRTKKSQMSLVSCYNKLIETRIDNILKECYDFSKISPTRKRELNFLINTYNNNIEKYHTTADFAYSDFTMDNFFLLMKLISNRYFKKPDPNKRKYEHKTPLEFPLYSIAQVRELLFVYQQELKMINYNCQKRYNKNASDLFKFEIIPAFEKINLSHSFYTEKNLPEIVNKLSMENISFSIVSVR